MSAPVVGHVGISVPDVDRAAAWYEEVLGFERIGPIAAIERGDGHAGTVAADVFGDAWGSCRVAHLAGANGVALELFEFVEPGAHAPANAFEYQRHGVFHVCLVTPHIEDVARRIADRGGRMRTSRIWELFEGGPHRMCYCEDPFGTVIEVYSHSHERTYANR